jgi:release factor glutamine methyltransferase
VTVTVRSALTWAQRKLSGAAIKSPRLDAEVILSQVMECNRLHLLVEPNKKLTSYQRDLYENMISMRLKNVPVAYITGKKEFYGIELAVGPGVLIPRPETEFLVEKTLEAISPLSKPRVADMCCGSGAVAVAVAVNNSKAQIFASDLSEAAEKYTRININKHQVAGQVFFMCGDLWQPFEERGIKNLDILVSNPPYIPRRDLNSLPEDVRKEPKIALDGGPDGFGFYDKILQRASEFLKPGGHIIFEIGWNQAKTLKNMLLTAGFCSIEVMKDYAGFDRVVSALFK